jgi:hypothetical protein
MGTNRRFDTQKLPPKKAAYGDEGKAVGCVPPTALLSLGWQFDLIEIKAARSGLVLFFLYLPLSLIFLKDEFDGWGFAAIYSF